MYASSRFQKHVVECSTQVPVSPFDNALAVDQIEAAYTTLLERPVASQQQGMFSTAHLAKDGKEHPRLVSLGGDHTIVCTMISFSTDVCVFLTYNNRSFLFFDHFTRSTDRSQLFISTLISIHGLLLVTLDLVLFRQKLPMEPSSG